MKFFVDTANIDEIRQAVDWGVCDGVTTNPSLVARTGKPLARIVEEITAVVDGPISVEATALDAQGLFSQACDLSQNGPNIVVKIPQETEHGVPCYGVIRELESEGIKVNATIALSLGQVILAAKAGATYISIFAGRVGDEGGDAAQVIGDSVAWLERWEFKSRIIVGSIRSVGDVLQAAMAGAHIITIPPQFLGKMADHQYSRETARQFVSDAQKALEKMAEVKG